MRNWQYGRWNWEGGISKPQPATRNWHRATGNGGALVTTNQAIKMEKIDEYRWRLPREGQMRTDGIVYASESMMADIGKDQSLKQVANVAWLPGIVGSSLAMPDIHWGYGFPIGGVAAFSLEDGVVSPGGVGYDIN
jgi:tRNA-splicing ligase RtcB